MAERPSEDCLFPSADRRLVVIFLLLLSFFSAGASISWEWVMPEKPLISKTRIACRLILDLENPELLSISLGDLPVGVTLTSGPNIRPVRQRDENRKWKTRTRVSWYFYLGAPGMYTMPPVSLEIAGMKQEIPIEDFIVMFSDEKEAEFPSIAEWRVPYNTLFKGQSFPATLTLLNQTSIRFPSSFYASFSPSLLSQELAEFGDIERTLYRDRTLYALPGKSWMLTPVKEGPAKLESGRFYLDKLKRYAPSVSVDILPVPAQISGSGAIGTFSRKISIQHSEEHLKELICTVSLSGEGNFDFLTLPPLEQEGLLLIDSERSESLIPVDKGYRGSISQTYRFSVDSEDSCQIHFPEYAYFQPSEDNLTGSVKYLEEETMVVDTEKYLHPVDFVIEREPLDADMILSSPADRGADWLRLLYICLPSLLIVMAAVLFPRKKGLFRKTGPLLGIAFIAAVSPLYSDLVQAVAYQKSGAYEKALPLYDKTYEQTAYSGILYNRALAAADRQEWLDALYYLRKAGRLSFSPADELVKELESEFGYTESPWTFSISFPSSVFIIIAVLVYLSALFFFLFRRTSRHVFLLVSLLCLCLFSGLLTWSYTIHGNRSRQLALLVNDAALHKLPDDKSDPWIHLPSGTDIQIQARQNGFILIDNGNSVQGWISDEQYRVY